VQGFLAFMQKADITNKQLEKIAFQEFNQVKLD
jgi:hypothetical protein